MAIMFEQIPTLFYQFFLLGSIVWAWLLFSEKIIRWFIERKLPKVRITSSSGSYPPITPTGDFQCKLNISILNQKENTIAINDIIATVRYNEEKWRLHHEEILQKFGTGHMIFSARPINHNDIIPYNLPGHESVRLVFEFHFPNVVPTHLDRKPLARFMGLIEGVQLYQVREDELYRNWDSLPIILRLTLSIDDGGRVYHDVPIYKTTTEEGKERSGALKTGDIANIESKFWEERNKVIAFEGRRLFE